MSVDAEDASRRAAKGIRAAIFLSHGRNPNRRLPYRCCSGVAVCRLPASAQTQLRAGPLTTTALSASDSQTREVTDETGRSIRVPQSIHRVVSLAPGITETLYALGLQDELVGDTDYCDYPPDAQRKPKVGGAINPSVEAIAGSSPRPRAGHQGL